MRRVKLFADLFLPRHFECVCCPADGITGPEDDWQNDPEKLHEAVCEVQRIRKMVHQGYIGDIEI